jgi:hypothetical protein
MSHLLRHDGVCAVVRAEVFESDFNELEKAVLPNPASQKVPVSGERHPPGLAMSHANEAPSRIILLTATGVAVASPSPVVCVRVSKFPK